MEARPLDPYITTPGGCQLAQEYSLRTFLRKAPNALLQSYLTERLGIEIPWHRLSETSVDEIITAIENAPEASRRQAENAFRDIHDMADGNGRRLFIEEGRDSHHNVELADILDAKSGHLECAFWVFLTHPAIFNVARRFHEADALPRPRKRDRLPSAEPNTDSETACRLGTAISGYYSHSEGRGYLCEVEHYRRQYRLYWFAYLSDYAQSNLTFNDDQQLEARTQRPAFQIVFVYDPRERSLEITLKGDKRRLLDLQCIFGNVVLGVDLRQEDPSRVVYDLAPLIRRDFPFDLEPDDGVDVVSVKRLRLRVIGADNERITLEAATKGNRNAVYDLLDRVVASKQLPSGLMQVTSVTLSLAFRAQGQEPARTVTLHVSTPDSCSLKHDPRHDHVRDLLKRWGIDVSGRPEDDPADARRPVQFTNRV
ncbi:hypothetical protein LLH03_03375 [bacterium]|nr:hypothetical protein [bacterium]